MSQIDSGPDPGLMRQLQDTQMQTLIAEQKRQGEILQRMADEQQEQTKILLEMQDKLETRDGAARAG